MLFDEGMTLTYTGNWFRLKRPITIRCSDGQTYTCRYQTFPHLAFWIFKGNKEILHGISQYSDIWQVKDTVKDEILFVTDNDWGKFSMKIEGKEIKEKEFTEMFGWKPFTAGLDFPKKEQYLIELAYLYLKDHWRSD